jgi:hypothetical protein
VDAPAIIEAGFIVTTVALPSTTEPSLDTHGSLYARTAIQTLKTHKFDPNYLTYALHYFHINTGSASGLYVFFPEHDNHDVARTRRNTAQHHKPT